MSDELIAYAHRKQQQKEEEWAPHPRSKQNRSDASLRYIQFKYLVLTSLVNRVHDLDVYFLFCVQQ